MKIVYVSNKILKDYASMNYYAGKVIGFKPVVPINEIWIDKTLSPLGKRRAIRHEKTEAFYMSKGYPYWKAHLLALKAEKQVK